MNKKKMILPICLYICTLILIAFYIIKEIDINFIFPEKTRIAIILFSYLYTYLANYLLYKQTKNKFYLTLTIWLWFALYLLFLFDLTLFDSSWGRGSHRIADFSSNEFKKYIESSCNFIPFKTIILYIKSMFASMLNTSNIFYNLIGNILCLIPMAFFLPTLFKKIDKWWKIFIILLVTTLFIELNQFITMSGSCDIDDMILNILGAMVAYKLLSLKSFKNLINNFFYLTHRKIYLKEIIIVIIPIIICIILIFILFWNRDNYYKKRLEKNTKIEVIDTLPKCDGTIEELFYTDKLYNYYFPCQKSKYVYVRINDVKFTLNELLNGNTKYNIDIRSLYDKGLKYYKTEKYYRITINESNVQNYHEEIEDNNILEIDYGRTDYNNEIGTYKFYIIPKEVGNTNVNFIFYNENNEIISEKKYNIEIDDNHNVNVHE